MEAKYALLHYQMGCSRRRYQLSASCVSWEYTVPVIQTRSESVMKRTSFYRMFNDPYRECTVLTCWRKNSALIFCQEWMIFCRKLVRFSWIFGAADYQCYAAKHSYIHSHSWIWEAADKNSFEKSREHCPNWLIILNKCNICRCSSLWRGMSSLTSTTYLWAQLVSPRRMWLLW